MIEGIENIDFSFAKREGWGWLRFGGYVLVQREMERRLSPLVSIARATEVCAAERNGNRTRNQRTKTATGFGRRSWWGLSHLARNGRVWNRQCGGVFHGMTLRGPFPRPRVPRDPRKPRGDMRHQASSYMEIVPACRRKIRASNCTSLLEGPFSSTCASLLFCGMSLA